MIYALDYQTYQQDRTPSSLQKKQKVSEIEYWEQYYTNHEVIYEWNEGFLEEKSVSDHSTYLIYQWFAILLNYFLSEKNRGKLAGLEMGFRLSLPHKTTIRRPDLGLVLNSNPVLLTPDDQTYRGIFDLCIEALSDSKPSEIKRDMIIKKGEYAAVGVKEYYILYGKEGYTEFYTLNDKGLYVPLARVAGEVIQSKILPGFQFRVADLFHQPSVEEMINDPVYQSFVLPGYTQAKQIVKQAEQRVQQAEQRAQQAEKRVRQVEQQAEAEIARLKRLLNIQKK